MSKLWRKIILAALSVALVIALAVQWRDRKLSYQGRPLSYWVAQIGTTNGDAALTAIREIGPAAIPLIFDEIQRPEPPWLMLYRSTYSKLPSWVRDRRMMPPTAWPRSSEYQCGWALSAIGPSAVPYLFAAFTNRNYKIRLASLLAVRVMGVGADDAAADLMHLLTDSNGEVRREAVVVAGRCKNREPFLPLLIDALKDRSRTQEAASVLGSMGPAAEIAAPELRRQLGTPDPQTRGIIVVALARIHQDTETMDLLISQLGKTTDSGEAIETLAALGEMGAFAKPAIPAILHSMKTNCWAPEQEWRRPRYIRTARNAVGHIDPSAVAQLPTEVE